jgi:cytidylate kinase
MVSFRGRNASFRGELPTPAPELRSNYINVTSKSSTFVENLQQGSKIHAMARLVLVTGPPGAGKSVVSRALADRFNPSVLEEGDAFFAFLASGRIEPWLPESEAQNDVVIRAAASAAGEYVRGGYTTIFDGVIGPWFLPTFADVAGLDSLDYVMLLPSADRCVDRVRTRLGHSFSDEAATRKMHHEFAASTIDARHVLVEPPEGVGAACDLIIAGLTSGVFTLDR